ncbi:MAG: histidine kinase, partial [Candidatus Kapaibacteriota bacterium]
MISFTDSPIPMYLINEEFDLIWSNPAFKEIASSPFGKKCYEAFFKSSLVCSNCPAGKSFVNKSLNQSIVAVKTLPVGFETTNVISQPIIVDGRKFVLNSVQKIVETQKQSSIQIENILGSIDFTEAIIEKLPFAIFLLTSDFTIKFANSYALKRFKITDGKNRFLSVREILNFKNQDEFEKLILSTLNEKNLAFQAEMYDKLGSTAPVDCFLYQIQNQEGIYLLVCKDITISALGDNFQPNEKKFLETILENLNSGAIINDSLNRTIYQSSLAKKILSRDNEFLNKLLKEQIKGNENFSTSIDHLTADGRKERYKVLIQNLDLNEKKNWLLLFSNVSEFEEIKRELEIYKGKLDKIEKNIRFASFVIDVNYNIIDSFGKFEPIKSLYEKNQANELPKFQDIIFEEDKFKIQEVLYDAFHFPNFAKEIDFRVDNRNETVWVKGIFENFVDERGKIRFVECFVVDINEQKKILEQLKSSQEEMRNLALYFESLREVEKKKLAFEIHDELGHLLTAMKLEMSWILKKKFLREDILQERLTKLIEMIETTIRKVRSISSQLRPSILDHFGIVAAIEWQAKEFQKQTAIRCRLNLPKQEIQLDEAKSIVVFRIFQEILTNIARHANATRVDINLEVVESNLLLTVSDNGKGIRAEDLS